MTRIELYVTVSAIIAFLIVVALLGMHLGAKRKYDETIKHSKELIAQINAAKPGDVIKLKEKVYIINETAIFGSKAKVIDDSEDIDTSDWLTGTLEGDEVEDEKEN